ncbi:MAG: crossover junction endodeoxyribonuclease RuvC [Spirochaetes bacterium]|jgi:crossover junction endodeoxyribonuclease RuvC|nr:crossover junction endodeoxyribonuclease RuvC [Spirochaetota bacterium]
MRILGIDPGYGILGWGVIDKGLKIVDYGAIETPSSMPIDERMFVIYTELSSIITEYKPDTVSIERQFFSKNTTTALNVAHAVGVVLLVLHQHVVLYTEYTPLQIKQALTGYGRADKKQMQVMIKNIFSLKEIPQPDDAADALAIAACHSFSIQGK